MLKTFLALSLLSNLSTSYVNVKSIEAYQNNISEKELVFNFESDYVSSHLLDIEIEVYTLDNDLIRVYTNQLNFIGSKSATTKIDFNMNENFYILVNVMYKDTKIIEKAKLNFYFQNDCYIDVTNKSCNRIYKSEYKDKVSKDILMNFKMNDNSFNKFLTFNELALDQVNFYSEYDFSSGNIYLLLEEEIKGYEIIYNEGYRFALDVGKERFFHFRLLDNYYVDLIDFRYQENYFSGAIKTNNIYFPYDEEYREYLCKITIEDFINIEINFHVATSDKLMGECDTSKYCLVRVRDD